MARVVLAIFVLLLTAGCVAAAPEPIPTATPAPKQSAALGWSEPFPAEAPRLVFSVDSFAVTEDGWQAVIRIANETGTTWRIGDKTVAPDRQFGLMLFATGGLDEVEDRNRSGGLPGIRHARTYIPEPPPALQPGQSWIGTISAPGALAAGLYVRVTFGLLTPVGTPPAGVPEQVLWITDNAYELKR